jgi:membrane fusion protein (multidrug efflux system)
MSEIKTRGMGNRNQKDSALGPETFPRGSSTNGDLDQTIEEVPLYRKRRIVIPVLLVVVAAVAGIWYWYVGFRDFVSTDDAYVDADRVSISSKILGRVAGLTVDEGDAIEKGKVLVTLDDSDLRAQRDQAAAALEFAQQSVRLARVNLRRAQEDFQRAEVQFRGEILPKEQFDHARSALDAAHAEYAIALARIATAKAQVGVVETSLANTIIASPIDGKVAKRWVLQGDVVQPGQPIFSAYETDSVWVTANLEETNLHAVRLGQDVEISVDGYPSDSFSGKVIEIGTYTASQFSLIPPNNASGNFTKVTQRVPVKISIRSSREGIRLLPGMSVEVKIKVR